MGMLCSLYVTILVLIYVAVFHLLGALWAHGDAKRRGMDPMIWLLIVLLTGIIGLILYFVIREEKKTAVSPPKPEATQTQAQAQTTPAVSEQSPASQVPPAPAQASAAAEQPKGEASMQPVPVEPQPVQAPEQPQPSIPALEPGTCPSCKGQLPPNAVHCPFCGMKL